MNRPEFTKTEHEVAVAPKMASSDYFYVPRKSDMRA
jgi:hypothetical protein